MVFCLQAAAAAAAADTADAANAADAETGDNQAIHKVAQTAEDGRCKQQK